MPGGGSSRQPSRRATRRRVAARSRRHPERTEGCGWDSESVSELLNRPIRRVATPGFDVGDVGEGEAGEVGQVPEGISASFPNHTEGDRIDTTHAANSSARMRSVQALWAVRPTRTSQFANTERDKSREN